MRKTICVPSSYLRVFVLQCIGGLFHEVSVLVKSDASSSCPEVPGLMRGLKTNASWDLLCLSGHPFSPIGEEFRGFQGRLMHVGREGGREGRGN